MTMQTRIADLITAIGTDYKQIRTWITGSSSGDLTTLTTTAKTSLLAAVNEVNAAVGAATIPDATLTVKGKVELATDAEALAMADTVRAITPSNFAGMTNVANGLLKLNASSQVPSAQLAAIPDATLTVKGLAELATDAEALAMTDTVRAITPSNINAISNVNNGLLKLNASGKVASAQLTADPDATTTTKGYAELATDPEALAMANTVVSLTPSNLAAITNVANGLLKLNGSSQVPAAQLAAIPDATTTVKGHAELATDAEALAMSDAIRSLVPANLAALSNVANGFLKLDGTGKAAAAQLPSYVDDALEYANLAALPGTGASGVIYVTADTNKTYRWTGTVYVEISASPGTTDALTEGVTNLYFTNGRADTRADARITALVGNTDTDLAALYVTAKA